MKLEVNWIASIKRILTPTETKESNCDQLTQPIDQVNHNTNANTDENTSEKRLCHVSRTRAAFSCVHSTWWTLYVSDQKSNISRSPISCTTVWRACALCTEENMSQFTLTYFRYSLVYERVPIHKPLCNLNFYIYSGTSIYRFSRGWRNKTMNAGKRLIRETITHRK